jgi:hypothetical protein
LRAYDSRSLSKKKADAVRDRVGRCSSKSDGD